MKYYSLEYVGYKPAIRINLGDDIQSIAAVRLMPKISGYVSRDALNLVAEPSIVAMNGFFLDSKNWPPSDKVIPIAFGFHISKKSEAQIISLEGLKFLKKFEPIGCRDKESAEKLISKGIAAYYSKCPTLTFDRREDEPNQKQVFIVGLSSKLKSIIPEALTRESIYVNQSKISLPFITGKVRREMANNLLESYRTRATLVITSRIHCAMPCIAMGIPVIFLYEASKKNDYRVKIINDLVGINYINEGTLLIPGAKKIIASKIDWQPKPLQIEDMKKEIKKSFQNAIIKAEENYIKYFS
jgi:hypothetical protein